MGFWQRVKKDLQLAMQEGADLFKEGTTTFTTKTRRIAKKSSASVKTEATRVGKIGKLRYQHFWLNKEAQKKFADIGGRIYDQVSNKTIEYHFDEPTQTLISEIEKMEGQIKKVKGEIQSLSKKGEKPPPRESGMGGV
ncbi:MAG TPA: hypothetical protein VGB26_11400 [Nitrospiria bacterium]|jgi:gas vesicle protein